MTRKRRRAHGHVTENNQVIDHDNGTETPSVDVNIDGSHGEGGGQIVRASLALSTILNSSVRITHIRYGRSKPGLQAQHASGARLLEQVAGGEVRGANVGSLALTYFPRNEEMLPVSKSNNASDMNLPFKCSINTAGSTALVMQAVLPAVLRFLPGTAKEPLLHVHGGTSVAFAPLSDYVRFVLAPNLRVLFGITLDYTVKRHGFYPRGGGECTISVDKSACMRALDANSCMIGSTLYPCDVASRGSIIEIAGVILTHGASYTRARVAEAMQQSAERTLYSKRVSILASHDNVNPGISVASQACIRLDELATGDASDEAACITLYATTTCGTVLGASALWTEKDVNKLQHKVKGANKLNREELWRRTAALVAESAAQDLCTAIESDAVVDSYMADQVCIFMAMAKGSSRLLIPDPTQHVRSVVDVAKMFSVDIRLEPIQGLSNVMLLCEGKGVILK